MSRYIASTAWAVAYPVGTVYPTHPAYSPCCRTYLPTQAVVRVEKYPETDRVDVKRLGCN